MIVKLVFASIAATLNLGLIIFISLRSRRHIVYQTFLLTCFCLLLWNLRVVISTLIAQQATHPFYFQALTRFFYPTVTVALYFLPVAALHFTISFVSLRSKPSRYLLRASYFTAALLSIVYLFRFTPFSFEGYILDIFMMPIFIASLFIMGRAYLRASRPLERVRRGLLFIAGSVGVLGAFIEDIMPALGYTALGIGNASNAFYSLVVAVTLFRHRLFDVNLRVRQLTGFVLALFVLTLISLLLSRLFHLSYLAPYGYIFVIVTVILLFGRRIMRFTENTLFRKLHSRAETTAEINDQLQEARNTRHLCELAGSQIIDHLKVQKVTIYIFDPASRLFRPLWHCNDTSSAPPVIKLTHSIAGWFQQPQHTEPFVCDEVIHHLRFSTPARCATDQAEQVLRDVLALGYELCMPIMLKDSLDGIVLIGAKKNKRPLTNSDIHVLKNITHAFMLWLQRFRMLERVRNLEQYAALGELAAFIAHEVKNPLAIIRSSAQLFNDQTEDQSLTIIIEECDRLNRTISHILQFAKTSTTSPSRIDLAQQVTSYTEELSASPQFRNIDIQVEQAGTVPTIMFDRDHLKQVIMNIMLNAAEALNGRGKIVLSLRSPSPERITLAIEDDGPGITPDVRERMCDPFYSTKPGGTGLGLPITHKLLELNNATMSIVSRQGSGCTVTIHFPCDKE
jgi:signal transduction histidine kinase